MRRWIFSSIGLAIVLFEGGLWYVHRYGATVRVHLPENSLIPRVSVGPHIPSTAPAAWVWKLPGHENSIANLLADPQGHLNKAVILYGAVRPMRNQRREIETEQLHLVFSEIGHDGRAQTGAFAHLLLPKGVAPDLWLAAEADEGSGEGRGVRVLAGVSSFSGKMPVLIALDWQFCGPDGWLAWSNTAWRHSASNHYGAFDDAAGAGQLRP